VQLFDIHRYWKNCVIYIVTWCRHYLPQDMSRWRENITYADKLDVTSTLLLTASNTFFKRSFHLEWYISQHVVRKVPRAILANILTDKPSTYSTESNVYIMFPIDHIFSRKKKKKIAITRGVLWTALQAVVWQVGHSITQGIIRTFIGVSRNSLSRFISNHVF